MTTFNIKHYYIIEMYLYFMTLSSAINPTWLSEVDPINAILQIETAIKGLMTYCNGHESIIEKEPTHQISSTLLKLLFLI